jgi:hypothetical protein
MSVNLKAYKTLFIKPDNRDRVVNLDTKTAFSTIYRPISQTLEDIHVLLNVNSTDAITYALAIVETDTDTGMPAISNLSDLVNGKSYVTVDVQPGTKKLWVKFLLNAYFTTEELEKDFAIVITSTAKTTQSGKNGIIYREIKSPESDNLKKSFLFNDANKAWSSRQDNNVDVSMNVFLNGDEIDDDNYLDAGTVGTSGADAYRGYELYVTVKNMSTSTDARNVILYATRGDADLPDDATEQTYAEETYLAVGQWFRYDVNTLPSSDSEFESLQKNAVSVPVSRVEPGQFILFLQPERIYPFPKVYASTSHTASSLPTPALSVNTSVTVEDPNSLTLQLATNEDLLLQQSPDDFKKFNIINRNFYKDPNGRTYSIGELDDYYIRRHAVAHADHGFRIADHVNTSMLQVACRRIYPSSEFYKIFSNPESRNQAIINRTDYTSIYSRYWNDLRFNFCAAGRFYDAKSTSNISTGAFQFGRLFPLSVENNADSFNKGDVFNENSAITNQIPYYVHNNIVNPITRLGNHIQSTGFCLFSGMLTSSFASTLVPELADTEAFTRLGLMDRDEFFGSKIQGSNAQGLVVVSHVNTSVDQKDQIDAFVVRKIDNAGIKLYGRCVGAGYFTSVDDIGTVNGQPRLRIYFPNFRFTQSIISDLTVRPTFFVPNPFKNKYLANYPNKTSFLIVGGSEHYLYVTSSLTNFKDAANVTSFTSSQKLPCYICNTGSQYETTGSYAGEIMFLFDNSSSVTSSSTPFYNTASGKSLTEIKQFVDALPSGVSLRIATHDILVNASAPAYDTGWTTNKTTFKAALDSLYATPTALASNPDDYDAALDAAASAFVGADDKTIFLFGDDGPTGSSSPDSGTVTDLLNAGIKVNSILVSPYNGDTGYMNEIAIETAGTYGTYYDGDDLSSTMLAMVYTSLSTSYGRAYGYGAFDITGPNTDFFKLYSDTGINSNIYGQFFGTVISEYDDSQNGWTGLTSHNVDGTTGYNSTYFNNGITLLFQVDSTVCGTNSAQEFYNYHNYNQILKFVLSNPGIAFSISYLSTAGAGYTEIYNGSSYASIEAALTSVFVNGTSLSGRETRNYETALTSLSAARTGRKLFLFGSNYPSSNATSSTISTLVSNTNVVHPIRIYPSLESNAMSTYAAGTSGTFMTYNSNANLSEIMSHVKETPVSAEYAYMPLELRSYSIIVPLTSDKHDESWNYFIANNTNYSGFPIRYVNAETVAYEVYLTPINEWDDSNSRFIIYKPHFSPEDYTSITDNSDFALFTFHNNSEENTLTDKNNYVVDLGASAPTSNRLSFFYKINVPSIVDAPVSTTAITSVKLVIQSATTVGFEKSDANTLTLFDGVIDIDPRNITTTSTGYTSKVAGHSLPDGFNLFLLDLSNDLQSSDFRYLRIYMEPISNTSDSTRDSIALSVAVNNLRVYHGG